MCSCHSVLECCVTFSGVKLSMRSFFLFVLLGLVTVKIYVAKLHSTFMIQ